MQRFGPSDIVRSKSQSTGFLSSPSGWQHYSFHVRWEWLITMHVNGAIITLHGFHFGPQFFFWSFVSYVFIFVKLRFGNQPRHHGAANRERKLTVTLFTVTSLSLLMWLPYVITTFLFFATNILMSLSDMAFFRLQHVSIILLYANSFLNPILYTLRMPGFRWALKMLCRERPQPQRQVEIIPLREINPQIWI